MSRELNEALSAALRRTIADGSYGVLYRRWFGSAPGSSRHPLPPPCPQDFPAAPRGELQDVLGRRRIRFGFARLGPPYSFEQDGRLTGWDIELGDLLAEKIAAFYSARLVAEPVEVEGVAFPVRLFTELAAGRFDAILSDLSITPERRQLADFTCAYLVVTFGVLRNLYQRDVVRIEQAADLDDPKVTVIVLEGAYLHEVADTYLPAASKRFVPTAEQVYRALESERGHVALLPVAAINAYLADPPPAGRGFSSPPFTVGPGSLRGIATRRDA